MYVSHISDVEYLDDTHTYLIDGVIKPSVSQIIMFLFPDKYKYIPKTILDRKAIFGTNVHNAIEMFEKGLAYELDPIEQLSFEQYLKVNSGLLSLVLPHISHL